jgi:zinc-ribbon domain
MLGSAFGADPPARDPATGNPRLATLQVEILPEYDRPSAALVILRGEVAADVPLPASVSLRIPASSGGPAAVAYSTAAGGNLLSLKYDRKDAGDFIALKFHTPERFIQIEFYDPVAITGSDRGYSYVWTGELAAERLSLIFQEPAAASDLSVQPDLEIAGLGQDGLRYRSAELGAFRAGKRLEVKVRYSKTDPRTSLEIVKPESRELSPGPGPSTAPSKMELASWLVGGVAVLGLGAWAALAWRSRRKSVAPPQPGGTGFCRKCGAPFAAGDRFCSRCGTPLA